MGYPLSHMTSNYIEEWTSRWMQRELKSFSAKSIMKSVTEGSPAALRRFFFNVDSDSHGCFEEFLTQTRCVKEMSLNQESFPSRTGNVQKTNLSFPNRIGRVRKSCNEKR